VASNSVTRRGSTRRNRRWARTGTTEPSHRRPRAVTLQTFRRPRPGGATAVIPASREPLTPYASKSQMLDTACRGGLWRRIVVFFIATRSRLNGLHHACRRTRREIPMHSVPAKPGFRQIAPSRCTNASKDPV
jgi:hypothetical protein